MDVAVIGSGPAGSTFARVVAEAGLDVVVFEKRKEVGVPVRCGEGLGEREIISQHLKIPSYAVAAEIVGAKLYAPNGFSMVFKNKKTTGWILDRRVFDKWLAEVAVEKGAKLRTYARAFDVIRENGKIKGVKVEEDGETYDVTADVVVSAEGMEAHIARKAGFDALHNLYDVDTCYQYEMEPYQHENLIELFFGNDISPRGYVWIFPKGKNKANVGIGIGGSIVNGDKFGVKGADPKVLLDRFIKNHPQLKHASILTKSGGVISVGAYAKSFVADNFVVIGTSAKQVDPIHGGGIAIAMESGKIAGDVVVQAFQKNDFSKDFLALYEKEWKATLGEKLGKRLKLRHIMEKLTDEDLNVIFSTLDGNDVDKILDGHFTGPAAKVIAKRPQLLRLLGEFI